LSLFTNYRQNWRNKSTHDHTLFFSEQEAFLAIVSICAFFNILLDQMLEQLAFDTEKAEAEKASSLLPADYASMSLERQMLYLLTEVSKEIPKWASGATVPTIREYEVMGVIAGFLDFIDPSINVKSEYKINSKDGFRGVIDFFLEKEGESLIVEVKTPGYNPAQIRRAGREQLLKYLGAMDTRVGILYLPPVSTEHEMVVETEEIDIGTKVLRIFFLYPRRAA